MGVRQGEWIGWLFSIWVLVYAGGGTAGEPKSPPKHGASPAAAARPRKLDFSTPSVTLDLFEGQRRALPGSRGALLATAERITADWTHIEIRLADSARGRREQGYERIAFEPWMRKGDRMVLVLPDEEYVIQVRDLAGTASGRAHAVIEITRGPLPPGTPLRAEGPKFAGREETGVAEVLSRIERFGKELSGATWTLIHCADEVHKLEAIQATYGKKPQLKDYDEEPIEFRKIIQAAGGLAQYRKRVAQLLANDDVAVRGFAAKLLGAIGDHSVVPELAALLRDTRRPVGDSASAGLDRRDAAAAIGMLGATEYARELSLLLSDQNPYVRAGAAYGLGYLKAKEYAASVAALLGDSHAAPCFGALFALAEMNSREHARRIAQLLVSGSRPDVSIPDAALSALMQLDAKEQAPTIAKTKSGTAATALAVLGVGEHIPHIVAMLPDADSAGDALNRRAALLALGILKAKQHRGEVVPLLKAEENFVRVAAAWSLVLMDDHDHAAEAIAELEEYYYGRAMLLTKHDLDHVPRRIFEQIQRRAQESLQRLRKGPGASRSGAKVPH